MILGEFLEEHDVPWESVMILTKAFGPDGTDAERGTGTAGKVNQQGLSRKIGESFFIPLRVDLLCRGYSLWCNDPSNVFSLNTSMYYSVTDGIPSTPSKRPRERCRTLLNPVR